jgi:hypothetical protein
MLVPGAISLRRTLSLSVTRGSLLTSARRELSLAIVWSQGNVYCCCALLLAIVAGRQGPGMDIPFLDSVFCCGFGSCTLVVTFPSASVSVYSSCFLVPGLISLQDLFLCSLPAPLSSATAIDFVQSGKPCSDLYDKSLSTQHASLDAIMQLFVRLAL